VVDYAREHNLQLVSLCTLGPSLEDVFLQITGQEIGTVRHEVQEAGGKRQEARGKRQEARGKRQEAGKRRGRR
ncbi:MAG: hypothetical protein DRI48_08115, partial [Chloroflexi bacterium]